MGKIYQTQQQLQEQNQENNQTTSTSTSASLYCFDCCSIGCIRIWNSFSFKCLFILILSVSLFLSAIFWIPPFNRLRSGFDANAADTLNVTAKASFRLQKPVSLLVPHTKTLEDDIMDEIGLPKTKVSILSIHQAATSNWTDVVFGVLPDPNNVPINLVSLSVLRSSLVELFLQQVNLSLTTSIFGKPSSFEILKLSGGINVVPVPSASIFRAPQVLFNFTLNNSISQIEDCLDQLRAQLKYGLHLRAFENVYVKLSNDNGSTVDPPVTVEASVLSDIGSHYLLPQRLKQLAQTITKSPPAKNLGLDHSVFGKVKGISLSSILNRTLHASTWPPSPSPSPSASTSPSPSPSEENYNTPPFGSPHSAPSPIYASSPASHDLSPCSHCGASFPYAPIPAFAPQPISPPISGPPVPSVATNSPRQSPCHGSTVAPSPVPQTHFDPSSSPASSPYASTPSPLGPTLQLTPDLPPSPAVSHGSHDQSRIRGQAPALQERASSPLSPSPSSSAPDLRYRDMWLIGVLVSWLFHFQCEPY
ncbi:hypothetical protein AQUCO_06900015v1 [Aquilegia coerulea]|uniref:DUF7036 domain-containing protein n=2 Tax=Aquilegia coerulea TaxID=218851 RepID=A0A2G5CAY4_AQUCA|nr:hypothetical protein AQUCO_06900015v1 [Aquilegia coerulea]